MSHADVLLGIESADRHRRRRARVSEPIAELGHGRPAPTGRSDQDRELGHIQTELREHRVQHAVEEAGGLMDLKHERPHRRRVPAAAHPGFIDELG